MTDDLATYGLGALPDPPDDRDYPLEALYAAEGIDPTPVDETFGLSQRGRLLSASETTYSRALERMFRSRLILQLERTIEANMNDPIALYEPLKVYLMLGGKAPKVDDELIVTSMRRGWEDEYPGPANRQGPVLRPGRVRPGRAA